jgi:hypothetical protein
MPENSPCGGVGEGNAIFLPIRKRPVKMKLHAASEDWAFSKNHNNIFWDPPAPVVPRIN